MRDRETAREAIVAFTFAVLGWTFVPLVGAILARVYANRADRAIDRHQGQLGGTELAAAARRLAGIWFLFFAFMLVIAFGFGVLAAVLASNDNSTSAHGPTTPTGNLLTHNPPPRVRVIGDCLHAAVRPTEIVLACGDGNLLVRSAHWSTWGAAEATGTGVVTSNDCTPNCADGTFHDYPASLALYDVRRGAGGRRVFTSLGVQYTKAVPPRGSRSQAFDLLTRPSD